MAFLHGHGIGSSHELSRAPDARYVDRTRSACRPGGMVWWFFRQTLSF